jgi:hypothetical protein
VRDYAQDAHYIQNPQPPLHSEAKYKPFLKGTPNDHT